MTLLPDACAVALKEWAGVCRALREGRQTLLLRKGGVREQAGRFVPEHTVFWLYPTHVHQAEQGLRDPANSRYGAPAEPGVVRIDSLVRVELLEYVTSEETLPALEPFHVWTRETISRRFAYRRPGLWALGVRVFTRDSHWVLTPTSDQLGCQSWVELEGPVDSTGLRPVLDDDTATGRIAELRAALAGHGGVAP
jgi:hypothetical protein